ncbi:MAG: hypothetical protein AAF968_18690 [Pseudomonadota bacterium]
MWQLRAEIAATAKATGRVRIARTSIHITDWDISCARCPGSLDIGKSHEGGLLVFG